MAWLYILFSEEADRYYIGHTTQSMDERLRRHLSRHSGFTGKVKDWKVVHCENFPTKAEAIHRERELKGWKDRERIKRLIAKGSEHPG